MFTCERCGNEFTEKTNLTRHKKNHLKDPTVSGQTYSCGVCDKVFSRADNRNRHEAAHNYSLTCGVCGQYFNRMDSLARHRAQHERPEAKQRPPMKRPVAPESGSSPKQRRTMLPPRTPMGNHVGPDVLPEDTETSALHRQHWQSIRTEEAAGNPIQERYNFTLHVYDLQEMEEGDIAARLVRRSPYSYQETMNLKLYEDHFRYVNDMEKYSHSFLCSKCDRLWKYVGMLHRHERTCTGDVIYKYPGGVYHTP